MHRVITAAIIYVPLFHDHSRRHRISWWIANWAGNHSKKYVLPAIWWGIIVTSKGRAIYIATQHKVKFECGYAYVCNADGPSDIHTNHRLPPKMVAKYLFRRQFWNATRLTRWGRNVSDTGRHDTFDLNKRRVAVSPYLRPVSRNVLINMKCRWRRKVFMLCIASCQNKNDCIRICTASEYQYYYSIECVQ